MKFENLKIRQEAVILYQEISIIFEKEKKYFFKDQILRATLSISNNIAEGFERDTNKELIRFLYIARGSCGEVRSMLHIAANSKYIDQETFEKYYNKTKIISAMIYKYIKTIQ